MSMQWKASAIDPARAHELLATQDVPKTLFSRGPVVRLDKAWHGLHWLLAGDPWKPSPGAGSAILGGTPVGDDLYGYGSALLIPASEVAAIAEGLGEISIDDLRARIDPKALRRADIYPFYTNWKIAEIEDLLLPAYSKLTSFYAKAAKKGNAVAAVIY